MRSWYHYFPWEDHRTQEPRVIKEQIAPRLQAWARLAPDPRTRGSRQQRLSISFGLNGARWDEELVVQRYELLFEAGLVPEAQRRRGAARLPCLPGDFMVYDHRRILATGIARLRAKIKYRPVVFELMPPSFTLLRLQHTVGASREWGITPPSLIAPLDWGAAGIAGRTPNRARRCRPHSGPGAGDRRLVATIACVATCSCVD